LPPLETFKHDKTVDISVPSLEYGGLPPFGKDAKSFTVSEKW